MSAFGNRSLPASKGNPFLCELLDPGGMKMSHLYVFKDARGRLVTAMDASEDENSHLAARKGSAGRERRRSD